LDDFPASGELVVLATTSGDCAPPPVGETLESVHAKEALGFAQRFEQAINNSPEAQRLAAGVIYRADPEFRRFAEQIVVPAGLYYLDDAAYAEARQRLTPDGMKQQIALNLQRLQQPGGAGSALKEFFKDPLGLI